MLTFVISSVICSVVLYLPYRLLLEKEKMLHFNRFYLLIALLGSIVLPLLPAPLSSPELPQPLQIVQETRATVDAYAADLQSRWTSAMREPAQTEPLAATRSLIAYLPLVWALVSLILGGRFFINLYGVHRLKRCSEKVRTGPFTIYLAHKQAGASSFFRAIFLNQKNYTDQSVHPAVIWHEQVHAKQGHSADILFVEAMICLFWFNPLLFAYRRAIKINHELLADDGVLRHGFTKVAYQQLILAQSANAYYPPLTSSFNFYTIKKRMMMMHKNTTPFTKTWKILGSMCMAALAFVTTSRMAFAQPTAPAPDKVAAVAASAGVTEALFEEYNAAIKNTYDSFTAKNGKRYLSLDASKLNRRKMDSIYYHMSEAQRKAALKCLLIPTPKPLPRETVTDAELQKFKNPQVYGVWINEKHVSNAELNKYKASDFAQVFISKLYGAAKKGRSYTHQLDLMTNAYYARYLADHYANTYQPPTK